MRGYIPHTLHQGIIDRPGRILTTPTSNTTTTNPTMPLPSPHPRRDSWPPTRVHLSQDAYTSQIRSNLQAAIDENPFAFFLTSPDDDEDDDDYLSLSDDDLNAGIETPDSASRSPVREISPSSLQRNPLPFEDDEDDEEEEYEFGLGLAIPLSLRDFTKARSTNISGSGRKSRTSNHYNDREQDQMRGLGISGLSNEFSARGRAKVRLVPGRGRGLSRSLSARKPASWRAPSPEIFSIREERESGEEEEMESYSRSAPSSSRVGGILASPRLGEGKEKVKKRVHWAI